MQISTVAGIVRRHGEERPDQVAIVYGDRALTWRELDATSSQVVFIAKSASALAPLHSRVKVAALPKTTAAPWTDDFSDIVTAVRRRR